MAITASSSASAIAVGVKNVQLVPGSELVQRKVGVIGVYDDTTYTTVTENVAQLVTSPEDAGSRYGFGSMIHRLVKGVWAGSNGVTCYVIPQAESNLSGTPAAAEGTITVSGPATAAGFLNIYVGGDKVRVSVANADSADTIATALAAAITADVDLPVSAAAASAVVTCTAKHDGTWGNDIGLAANLGEGEEYPTGVSVAVVDMASGAGLPDISGALDGLGTGDDANSIHLTDVVHGYGVDATTLNELSTYNGTGNTYNGCYDKINGRFFRAFTGHTEAGSSGLSTLTTLGATSARKDLDRTSTVIPVPGSPNHPAEIAAIACGVCAATSATRAEENYRGKLLPGVIAGVAADRWTSSYDSRDTAVKAGISTTTVKGGTTVYMSDTVTFYHPDNVPSSSNGYKSVRNISILQNIAYNLRLNFEQDKWEGTSIVNDVTRVSKSVSADKARDISAVRNDLIALARSFEAHAWIFTATYTIDALKEASAITIRSGGQGFDVTMPLILAGENNIMNIEAQFDTSLAALGL